jgi:hypothetical protein
VRPYPASKVNYCFSTIKDVVYRMPVYCTSPNPLLKERAAIENFKFVSNNLFKNQTYKNNGIQLPLLQERAGGEVLPSRTMNYCFSTIKDVVYRLPEYCTSPHPLLKERAAFEEYECLSNILNKNQIIKN